MLQTYRTLSTETPYDVAIKISYPLDSFVSLMKSNDLELNTDLSLNSVDVEYNTNSVVKPKGGQVVVRSASTTSTTETNAQQNIFDFILNSGGDFNNMIAQLKDNEYYFRNLNTAVPSVFTITYKNSFITDYSFKNASKNINFTTGDSVEGYSYDFGFDYSFDS